MNKKELVNEVAGKVGISKKEVANVIDAFTEAVSDALSKGERVMLVGFGTFDVVQKKARKGRNPQTGKEIQIPARKAPRFRPGKELRSAVS